MAKSFKEVYLKAINEARDPELKYTTTRTSGKKHVETIDPAEIDRVATELAGVKSGVATKLAQEFKMLKEQTDAVKAKKEELDQRVLDLVENTFDPTDAVWTRVIETCSLVITATKAYTQKGDDEFDADGFFTELMAECMPELQARLSELRTKYTVAGKEVKYKSSVKVKLATESTEGEEKEEKVENTSWWKTIKNMFANLTKHFTEWGKSYDEKLEDIAEKYGLEVA